MLGMSGGLARFLKSLVVRAGIYLLCRLIAWWRNRLLWSLRNRLIVAYLFIAVVPILLIVALVQIACRVLYSHLGAYLLHDDIHNRIEMIAAISDHNAAAHHTLTPAEAMKWSESILP